MTNKRLFFKILTLTLLGISIVACSTSVLAIPTSSPGTITICHATGDSANPYTQMTVAFQDLAEHSKHPDDLIPAPGGVCPSTLQPGTNNGKITICHAAGAGYQKITIAFSGLNGHAKHTNDIIPMPETGCPPILLTATITMTPTPSPTGPTPTATLTATITATPEATQIGDDGEKITICHATGSKKNPYVEITISKSGLNGHSKHSRDIIPAPAGGCP